MTWLVWAGDFDGHYGEARTYDDGHVITALTSEAAAEIWAQSWDRDDPHCPIAAGRESPVVSVRRHGDPSAPIAQYRVAGHYTARYTAERADDAKL